MFSHSRTIAFRSGGHSKSEKACCHRIGNHACGVIWRSDRKTFQVTASSLLTLYKCLSLLARMSANTGS